MKKICLVALFAAASAFAAAPGDVVAMRRMPGDRLDISVANEVTHAALIAQSWLIRGQNADGSWGSGTNQLFDTMVALFALKSFRQPEAEKAIGRADAFLAKLKLDHGFPSFPFGANLKVDLEKVSAAWPLPETTAAKEWWAIACSLNRAKVPKKGAIAGRKIDWRRDIAQRLISTQKIADKGDGFWKSQKEGVSDIAETAFMLMVFFEL